jgi:hypothetical protein
LLHIHNSSYHLRSTQAAVGTIGDQWRAQLRL